jgi:hypothetical protein
VRGADPAAPMIVSRLHARRLFRLVWLAYPGGRQPRLPDPSYASPALVLVPEDKSGIALAWSLSLSIVISYARWPGAGTRPPE